MLLAFNFCIHLCDNMSMWHTHPHKICHFVQKKAKFFIYRNHVKYIYYFTSIKAYRIYKFSDEKKTKFISLNDKLTTHLFVFRHIMPPHTHHRTQTHCYLSDTKQTARTHFWKIEKKTCRVYLFSLKTRSCESNFNIGCVFFLLLVWRMNTVSTLMIV